MAKPEDLKQGVEVWIKAPAQIYAEVIGPRPGDAGLPPNEVNFMVRIQPNVQYLPADALELADPPKDPNARLEYMSREWTKEMAHCNELLGRAVANPSDRSLAEKVLASLSKLGFFIERP